MTNKNLWWLRVAGVMLVVTCLYAFDSWTAGEDAGVLQKASSVAERGRDRSSPRTYIIQMPDFHGGTPQDQPWRANSVYIQEQLSSVADEALVQVADSTLSIEPRLGALAIADRFCVEMTGPELVATIDFKDDRLFASQPVSRGRYPIVTVLVEYGPSAVPCVIEALRTEVDVERRNLLCDVLEKAAGFDFAEKALTAYLKTYEVEVKGAEREKLTQAFEEIRKRQQRAIDATPKTQE